MRTERVKDFFSEMYRDIKRTNKEIRAVDQLETAVENYERVMGVKLKIEIAEELCF